MVSPSFSLSFGFGLCDSVALGFGAALAANVTPVLLGFCRIVSDLEEWEVSFDLPASGIASAYASATASAIARADRFALEHPWPLM